MLSATLGTWANYATTLAFQVIFAIRFGNSSEASVFVVAFGLALALGTVATASVRSVVVPRLVSSGDVLVRSAVRIAICLVIAVSFLLVLLALLAPMIAAKVADHAALPAGATASALRAAAAFVALEVISGTLIAFALALGRRLAPAAAPALPSVAGAVLLGAVPHPTITWIFVALSVGSAFEIAGLLYLIGRRRLEEQPVPRIGWITALTAAQFGLFAFVPAIERIMAAAHDPGGAAAYNYALRSLAVVQQLLLGGWTLASLGDWSTLVRRRDIDTFRSSLQRTLSGATVLLVFAASIGAVLARVLVGGVFQHGAFTPADTHFVARLVVLALPGFCADGLSIILSQALLANRKNTTAIGIGFGAIALRIGSALVAGHFWGASGVAVGYSLSALLVLCAEIGFVIRATAASVRDFCHAYPGAAVAGATAMVTVLFHAAHFSPGVAAIAISGCFGLLLVVVRPPLPGIARV